MQETAISYPPLVRVQVQKTLTATKYADLWDLKWLGFFRVFIGYSRREELIGIQKASLDEQSSKGM